MTDFVWRWTGEAVVRLRTAALRRDSGSTGFDEHWEGGFAPAAGSVVLSAGYKKIIRSAGYSARADLRVTFIRAALVVLDGHLCRVIVWPFVGARRWCPLVLEEVSLDWVLADGQEATIRTVFVADEHGIVVALASELPLPLAFPIERQLLRAERSFRAGCVA